MLYSGKELKKSLNTHVKNVRIQVNAGFQNAKESVYHTDSLFHEGILAFPECAFQMI